MQDYISIAHKNGVELLDIGACQFCGAKTTRGVHECMEVFSLGFNQLDFAISENHYYRFLSVDAHTLQHPEIHGRWNNHFHLLRLHLIFKYNIQWDYQLSPKLSDHLNRYKAKNSDEILIPPEVTKRGEINIMHVVNTTSQDECKHMIRQWSKTVYDAWGKHHRLIDHLAITFL